jgi:hypothetical protein
MYLPTSNLNCSGNGETPDNTNIEKYSNVLTGVLLVSFRLTKYRMIIVPTPIIDITDKITAANAIL